MSPGAGAPSYGCVLLTQGRYTIAFSHYEPVPPNLQAQLASQYKVKEET